MVVVILDDGFCGRSDGQVELRCALEVEATIYEAGPNFHTFSEVKNLRVPSTLYYATHSPFLWDLVERLAVQSEYLQEVSIEGDHLALMTLPDVLVVQLLQI